mmetsp:Transcript_32007/g.69047  ORF Transcript_32007/g.69047 Transcript_32007/m.69047 type:complete len:206 (-) Transcript_32007:1833-2450(-)
MTSAVINIHTTSGWLAIADHCVGIALHSTTAASRPPALHQAMSRADKNGHVVLVQRFLVASTGANGTRIPEVVPARIPRKIQLHRLAGLWCAHQQGITHKEVAVSVLKSLRILKIMIPNGSDHWKTKQCPLGCQGVPHGQQPVARQNGAADLFKDCGAKDPGLTAFAGEMCMGPIERIPNAQLMPSHKQLQIRVTHEASHISTSQ